MQNYTLTVTCIIAISSVLMFFILNWLKLFDFKSVLSISLASFISALLYPGIFYMISGRKGEITDISTLLPITVITTVIYLLFTFVISIIISKIISRSGTEINAAEPSVTEDGTPGHEKNVNSGDNYLEKIFDTIAYESSRELENNKENTENNENNLEKSVDTSENIDKMGIEYNVQDSDIMTIDECIEEAFSLKAQGDFESAIIYFMYALDKNPAEELIFWIVLDICVMYKNLGQAELAFEILNSYHDSFGDIMDEAVRKEIEDNLASMQA